MPHGFYTINELHRLHIFIYIFKIMRELLTKFQLNKALCVVLLLEDSYCWENTKAAKFFWIWRKMLKDAFRDYSSYFVFSPSTHSAQQAQQ